MEAFLSTLKLMGFALFLIIFLTGLAVIISFIWMEYAKRERKFYKVKHRQEICYKSNKPCIHDCKGLCRESC